MLHVHLLVPAADHFGDRPGHLLGRGFREVFDMVFGTVVERPLATPVERSAWIRNASPLLKSLPTARTPSAMAMGRSDVPGRGTGVMTMTPARTALAARGP